jgi:hypothetical protein
MGRTRVDVVQVQRAASKRAVVAGTGSQGCRGMWFRPLDRSLARPGDLMAVEVIGA